MVELEEEKEAPDKQGDHHTLALLPFNLVELELMLRLYMEQELDLQVHFLVVEQQEVMIRPKHVVMAPLEVVELDMDMQLVVLQDQEKIILAVVEAVQLLNWAPQP